MPTILQGSRGSGIDTIIIIIQRAQLDRIVGEFRSVPKNSLNMAESGESLGS